MKTYSYGKKYYSVSDKDFEILSNSNTSLEERKEILSNYHPINDKKFYIKSVACFIITFLLSLLQTEGNFLESITAYVAASGFIILSYAAAFGIVHAMNIYNPYDKDDEDYQHHVFFQFYLPLLVYAFILRTDTPHFNGAFGSFV